MENHLDQVLINITDKYKTNIQKNARNYMEVDIGKEADKMGYTDVKEKYHKVFAVVPLKKPVPGMKVRIDGRSFVNYAQFESGIAVPGYVVKDSRLPHDEYIPLDSMIYNFA